MVLHFLLPHTLFTMHTFSTHTQRGRSRGGRGATTPPLLLYWGQSPPTSFPNAHIFTHVINPIVHVLDLFPTAHGQICPPHFIYHCYPSASDTVVLNTYTAYQALYPTQAWGVRLHYRHSIPGSLPHPSLGCEATLQTQHTRLFTPPNPGV